MARAVTSAIEAIEGFTFGCDPELFVLNEEGVPVSAAGLIPGTKDEPHPVNNGAVQVDGMAAEFNIDPVSNFSDWNRNIASVMKQLEAMLPTGHTLSAVPAIRFSHEVFEQAPAEAKMLGCDPDFNAWTGSMNPPPDRTDDPYLSVAAGHIHFGWGGDLDLGDEQHIMNCRDLVRQLDWFLGAWSVKLDSDPTRRKLYGKAGAYRPKPYGVEYRVLSNFWITTRDRRLAVWNRMQKAIFDMRRRFIPDIMPPSENEYVVRYINESKRDKAFESAYHYPILSTNSYYARY